MASQPPSFDMSTFSLSGLGRRLEKPWGFEVLLSPPDAPYTAKLIHVDAGKRLSLQVHDTKVETQTLVAGRGVLVLEAPTGSCTRSPWNGASATTSPWGSATASAPRRARPRSSS